MPIDAARGMSRRDIVLYAVLLFGWSTSWIAIRSQVGVVAPEISVAYRFALAALIMLGWMVVTKQRLAFALADHARFALLGGLMFSTNFTLFYYAGLTLESGLLAVIFGCATFLNILFARIFYRDPVDGRVALGAFIGMAGLVAIFWPRLSATAFDAKVLAAMGLGVCGTTLFSLGNMMSRHVQRTRGVSVMSANTWAMVYGAVLMAVLGLVRGEAFGWDTRPSYLLSFLWLAIFATIFAFWAYVNLLVRIGPQRVGYATVVFPVLALLISTVMENYQWSALSVLGVALVITGNLVIMRRGR